jgi:hypothetical protein
LSHHISLCFLTVLLLLHLFLFIHFPYLHFIFLSIVSLSFYLYLPSLPPHSIASSPFHLSSAYASSSPFIFLQLTLLPPYSHYSSHLLLSLPTMSRPAPSAFHYGVHEPLLVIALRANAVASCLTLCRQFD